MSLKLNQKMNNCVMLNVLANDDSSLNIELGVFAKNMKKEVVGVIDFFLYI
jgi:hypothetical protein